jgi:uncharacterized protein YdeI (BOF family)
VPTVSPEPTDPGVDLESIATARSGSVGTAVHVAGLVTTSSGVVGADDLFAIADSSGGIFVRLAAPVEGVEIGRAIDIVGVLAAPYGQIEVREIESLTLGASDGTVTPIAAALSDIGEGLEGSLVSVAGTVNSVTSDNGRLTITVADGETELRVLADPLSGIVKTDVVRGEHVALTGIVGQRASALGREDGYRLWLRMRTDLSTIVPTPSPTVSPVPSPTPTVSPVPTASATPTAVPTASPKASATPRTTISPTAAPVYHDLATGLAVRGRTVDVDATVTAAVGIIDWGGPTIVVDDGTAAVAVVIPDGAASPRVGVAVRIVGKSGSLHSGRRVVATVVELRGDGVALKPRRISTALGAGDEWEFVSVYGRIQRLTHAGSRWRADLAVGGQTVAVLGEPGARISAVLMIVGRLALVTGIVRRSTSDSSVFQVLPRSAADLTLGPVPAAPGGTPSPAAAVRTSGPGASGSVAIATAGRLVTAAEIPDNEGATVTVAGVIVEIGSGTAMLDDGTGRILLGGSAASDAISLLEPGDAVEVTGQVSRDADGWLIEVDPDLIVSLAGVPAAATSSDVRSEIASPGVEGTAATAPALAGELPAAGGQAHGLARPAEGMAGSNPIAILAFVGAGLISLILIGLAVALVARKRGKLTRPRRFARRGCGAHDADGATSR